jgi:hypothetical protein
MDAAADAARYQLTDAPESPFTVEFATEVLVEIRQAALEAFRSLPYGGLEIGGVLFGSVAPSGRNPKRVEVAAMRPIECDHAAGPAFILSSAERVRLTQLFERARQEEDLAALAVVGFWVSHGRSELGMTSHDADLYRAFFPHPWQVALMLKPENRQPLREAMFCRVNARVVPYRRPAEPVVAPSVVTPSVAAPSIPVQSAPAPSIPEPSIPEPSEPDFVAAPEPATAPLAEVVPEPEATALPEAAPLLEATPLPEAAPSPEAVHEPAVEPLQAAAPAEEAAPVPEPAPFNHFASESPYYPEPAYTDAAEPEPVYEAPASFEASFQNDDFPVRTAAEERLLKKSFQERAWQEQAFQPPPLPEPPSHELTAEPPVSEPAVVKPPTAAELPRFATDIYLPTPPVEPPSPNKAWSKDLYRPAGRARALIQALPVAEAEPAHHSDLHERDLDEEVPQDVPRLRSYWETEPEPVAEHPREQAQPEAIASAPPPLPDPPSAPVEVLEAVEEEATPAPAGVAVLEPQDHDANIPPSFDLSGSARPVKDPVVTPITIAKEQPPALPAPVAADAETIPGPGFTRGRNAPPDVYVAPKPEAAKLESQKPDAPKPEPADAPAAAPLTHASEIEDELARLLVSIRAAAADTKTKRPSYDEVDDPAVREPRQSKHSFGLITVVLLMIVGLVLGGVLGYWFFGNHQQVAAKAPGPDLALEMFNTGKEVLIHWDAKSPLVLNARTAELRIHDSGMVQTLLLDLSGLSRGYYRYQPTSSDVQTTLIVTENDGHTEQSVSSRFEE